MPQVDTPDTHTRNDGFTATLKGIEVFRAGTHPGVGTWTPDDLKSIVECYDPKLLEARITVDHVDDGPKHGIVERVYTKGKSLFADMAVTPSFHEVVQSGAYRDRSVEIYPNLADAKGKNYLSAVSFLGAMVPAVKGMAPIKFADAQGRDVIRMAGVESTTLKCADFPRPADATTGTLTKTGSVSHMLGHSHDVAMDDEGNGFTSGPCSYDYSYDYSYGGYRTPSVGQPGFHQHLISNSKCLPADDGSGNIHTHALTYLAGDSAQETIMAAEPKKADPITPTPAPVVTASETPELIKMRDQLAAAEKKSTEAEARLAVLEVKRTNETELRRFSDAVAGANKGGVRVTPAEVDDLRNVYMSLPSDSTVVKFSDANDAEVTVATPRKLFLGTLEKRPVVIPFGEIARGGKPPVASGDTDANTAKVIERANILFSEKKADNMSDAIKMAASEVLKS